jgi:hypothetical protein
MSPKAKIRTLAAFGCASLALAALQYAGGNPGAMPAPFVLFEMICEIICGAGPLFYAKRLHEKQKRSDS